MLALIVFLPLIAFVAILLGAPARRTAIYAGIANLILGSFAAAWSGCGCEFLESSWQVLAKPEIHLAFALDGMSAIAHGENDETVLAVSRVLSDWSKAHKENGIKILGGYMDGKVLNPADVATLATLPSKDELLSMIASAVVAPMQNIGGQINEMLSGVARAVDAVREQKEAAA